MSILRHIKLNYETKVIEGKHELAEELIEYSPGAYNLSRTGRDYRLLVFSISSFFMRNITKTFPCNIQRIFSFEN